jgi:DMSO/TMAO reductase YedYZ molybdopterin-dependent catalytic subunit
MAGDRLMSPAAVDRLLAVLVAVVGASGLLTLRAGTPDLAWLFVFHGLLAGSLLAAILLKLRGSLGRAVRARRWSRLAVGLLVSVAALGSIGAGYAWAASGTVWTVSLPSLGSVTVLTLHVWLGLALLPILAVHLLPKRWRLLRPRLVGPDRAPSAASFGRVRISRRSVLAGLAFGGTAAFAFGAANVAERLAGGARRFTGSRLLASGGVPPATTFFGEAVPSFDPAGWQLSVAGRLGHPSILSLDDLRALGETQVTAILDCTSGWAIESAWRGVTVAAVLEASGVMPTASTIEVRSLTGWGASFPLGDAGGLLLATGVAGGDLPLANGAPLRLVAPNRRGLDWVKWVAEIRVS